MFVGLLFSTEYHITGINVFSVSTAFSGLDLLATRTLSIVSVPRYTPKQAAPAYLLYQFNVGTCLHMIVLSGIHSYHDTENNKHIIVTSFTAQ